MPYRAPFSKVQLLQSHTALEGQENSLCGSVALHPCSTLPVMRLDREYRGMIRKEEHQYIQVLLFGAALSV